MEVLRAKEVLETQNHGGEGFQDIKPKTEITLQEAKDFCDKLYYENGDVELNENSDPKTDVQEKLEVVVQDYFKDLKEKSEVADTIPEKPFSSSDLTKRTAEENAEKREEYALVRSQLKREWEIVNGRAWPKYDCDIYSAKGELIRKAGNDYDAHHIQPLTFGGENVVSNITPLSAVVHYDKQGVHAPNSPYSKMDQMLGGNK